MTFRVAMRDEKQLGSALELKHFIVMWIHY